MKIDLNKNMTSLDGKEIQNSNIGQMIAVLLCNANLGDPNKTIGVWASDLKNGKALYLNDDDCSLFLNFINGSNNIADLLKFRILEIMEQKKTR